MLNRLGSSIRVNHWDLENVTVAVNLVGQASSLSVLILTALAEVERRQAEAYPT
jgi:hypothetical protein